MRLNDVWRNVNKEIGFYTKETFDSIPPSAGVYAWFYPLRVTTTDPLAFLEEVNTILNYDAQKRDQPSRSENINFAWNYITLKLCLKYKIPKFDSFIEIWNKVIQNEDRFDYLRQVIMKASIFMSPLYVGKASNLQRRCKEHINGNDKSNNFNCRYTTFAKQNGIRANKISDLLFTCIKIDDVLIEGEGGASENLESLVEEFLKYLAKPIYSVR